MTWPIVVLILGLVFALASTVAALALIAQNYKPHDDET